MLPKWRSSWRWRPGPMPGMSDSAERSVSRRRWPRWKLTAKRCASSRSACSTNISALLGRIGIASFACGRKTRSGFLAVGLLVRPLLACRGGRDRRRRRTAGGGGLRCGAADGAASAAALGAARGDRLRSAALPAAPRRPRLFLALLRQRDDRKLAAGTDGDADVARRRQRHRRAVPCRRRRRSGRAASSASSSRRPPRSPAGTAATAPRTSTRSRRCRAAPAAAGARTLYVR